MKRIDGAVTIICMYNSRDEIEPVKYRIRGRDGIARTYPFTEVSDIRYCIYGGDKTISYTCKADVEGSLIDCIVRFDIDEGRWDLYSNA